MKLQTHRDLAEDDLNRIERLVEASTAGPWYSYAEGRDAEAGSNYIELGWCNELGSFKSMEIVGGTIADQDFIANARQDVPRLLLEVRVLRARLEAMRDAQIGPRKQSRASALEGSSSALSA
jgi:hypothetical protein